MEEEAGVRPPGGERALGARAVVAWLAVSLAAECERPSSRPDPGREERLSGGGALWGGAADVEEEGGGGGTDAPLQSCMISVAARSMRDQHRSCTGVSRP